MLIICQEKLPDELKPNEAIIYNYSDGSIGVILVCPKCSKPMVSATDGHKYNRDTQTVTPSMIHDIKLGGCGWHGFLKNGEFITA